MSSGSHAQTSEVLDTEINDLQSECEGMCINIVNKNEPFDVNTPHSSNANERKACSIDSVASEVIQNEETPISNVNINALLSDLKELVIDVDKEIKRLRENVKRAQEAKSRPWAPARREEPPAHSQVLQRAKQRHGLLRSLLPDAFDAITGVLDDLVKAGMDENSSGYIQVTPENVHQITLLKDKNILSFNPQNDKEVKLTFNRV